MKRKFLPKNMHTPETWKNKKKRYEQKTSICDPQTFSENSTDSTQILLPIYALPIDEAIKILKNYPSNTNVEISLYVNTSTFMQYDQIHHKDSMTSELNLNKPIIHARQEQTNFMQGDSTVHAGGIVPEVDWGKPVEYIPHNYISYDHYCPNCQSYY